MAVQGRLGTLASAALLAGCVTLAVAPPGEAALEAGGSYGLIAVDRAAAMGLYAVDKSWAATAVDYDGDGDEDVWVGYHQWSGKLWRNDGGVYTRVAPSAWPRTNPLNGKVPDRHDCAFADVDLDGRQDAYCSAGRNQNNLVKYGMENQLWLQRAPDVFTEVGVAWGVGDLCGRGRHVQFLNVNGDEYPDLFVGNAEERSVSDPCNVASNGLPDENSKIFINQSGTGFVQLTDSGLTTLGVGQRCAVVLDFDKDGRDDLVTCRYNTQPPRLYRNIGGRFSDVSAANGLTKPLADISVADLDGDGWQDLVTAAVTGFAYRLNLHGSFGPEVLLGTAGPGKGRSVAVGDADGDGDQDVYALLHDDTAATNPDDVLFINAGMSFTRLAVPSATGNADEVIAIHPRADGRTSFLVLNGGDPVGHVGPVQVIEVFEGEVPDVPPTATFPVPQCSGLTCNVDGSGSHDPEGTPLAYAWAFGDGETSSLPSPTHTYASAGTYQVSLTVTDEAGSSASTSRSVTVIVPGTGPSIAFRAASGAEASARSLVVPLPSGIQPGDVALMFVTVNSELPSITAPSPWQLVQQVTDSTMQTRLYWRTATAGMAGSVTVTGSRTASVEVQVLAYSGVAASIPLVAAAVEPTWRISHTTPTLAVLAGDWVVSYWADKSSGAPSTGWTTPSSVTRRLQQVPASSTYRVSSVSADSGGPVSGTSAGGLTAQAALANNIATLWTVRLRPAP